MNVLFLTNIPSPYRVEFFNELGKHCKLTVLFERKSAKDREQQWLLNSFNTFKAHFLSGLSIGNDSAFSFEVLKLLKSEEYDIVVVGGYSTPTGMLAIKYLKLKKIPFVLNADGGMIKKDSRCRYLFKRFFISSARAWLSSSDQTTKYLMHYGANEDTIYKFPFTSIRSDEILNKRVSKEEKDNIRKELNITEDRVILTVGQFIPRKGLDILLKSSALIDKSIGFYIIGGKPTEEYSALKKSLHLNNVNFIDFKNKYDLFKYFKAADIFVLPTREDIWGLVINEAMAYGLPIITTDKCVAGLELIEDWKNGFIVPVDDEKILAEKISIALKDDELLEKMAINNLRKIKQYTIENMAKVHMDIFAKLK